MRRTELKAFRSFVKLMEAKLRENEYKGTWQENFHLSAAIGRLDEELNELKAALWTTLDRKSIAAEAADVANFAMMIADIANGLERT